MRNSRLDEAQAELKTARRNINDLRYADDTTLRAESEELKSLLTLMCLRALCPGCCYHPLSLGPMERSYLG